MIITSTIHISNVLPLVMAMDLDKIRIKRELASTAVLSQKQIVIINLMHLANGINNMVCVEDGELMMSKLLWNNVKIWELNMATAIWRVK